MISSGLVVLLHSHSDACKILNNWSVLGKLVVGKESSWTRQATAREGTWHVAALSALHLSSTDLLGTWPLYSHLSLAGLCQLLLELPLGNQTLISRPFLQLYIRTWSNRKENIPDEFQAPYLTSRRIATAQTFVYTKTPPFVWDVQLPKDGRASLHSSLLYLGRRCSDRVYLYKCPTLPC